MTFFLLCISLTTAFIAVVNTMTLIRIRRDIESLDKELYILIDHIRKSESSYEDKLTARLSELQSMRFGMRIHPNMQKGK